MNITALGFPGKGSLIAGKKRQSLKRSYVKREYDRKKEQRLQK
ncbi:hypothetical protein E6C60_4189 [Paenibacillus algicola]|uniref:Uncharacterized protein n=1 Tax=Paenibacillus algicola TaxID=2565926 RepID=A0A4V1G4J3_9BACL|nr:hypothetical protein E6C60_4189 [Paenibacillus algicola]